MKDKLIRMSDVMHIIKWQPAPWLSNTEIQLLMEEKVKHLPSYGTVRLKGNLNQEKRDELYN